MAQLLLILILHSKDLPNNLIFRVRVLRRCVYTVPGAFQVHSKFIPSSFQVHSKVTPRAFQGYSKSLQVHSKCSPSAFLVHILSIALTCIARPVQKHLSHLELFIALAVWWCSGAHSKCIVTLTMHSQVQWLACAAEAASAFPDL